MGLEELRHSVTYTRILH